MAGIVFKTTRKIIMLMALAILATATTAPPAQAAWAIAIVEGKNPIVSGDDDSSADQSRKAIKTCNSEYNTTKCKIIAKGHSSCVALSNNGGEGDAIRWWAGVAQRSKLAQINANNACRKAGAPHNCRMVHWFCK